MHKNVWVAALLAGLLSPALAGTTTPPIAMEDVLTMRVDGEVVVDSKGRLVSHTIKTKLPSDLRMALDKGMAAWEFDPPNQGAADARTPVRITLVARTLSASAIEIRLDNISFQSRDKDTPRLVITRKWPEPQFPSYMVTGVVTLDLAVGPDGRVIDVAATQCSLHNTSGARKRMKEACDEMEANGLRAVRKWRFDFKGPAGHEPSYPMTGTLPIYYYWAVDRSGDTGEWRKESRTAHRRPAWRPAEGDEPRVGTSDVSDSALVQGDPALRLKDGFIGTVL